MSHRPRKSGNSLRPRIDVLETRELLSTLTVTSSADSGPGSLRAEVAAAASGDTITFDAALDGATILLTSGPVSEIGKSLTIQGPGADQLTISGGGTVGILNFAADPNVFGSSIDVTVSGLTLANGFNTTSGGAIQSSGANLTLSDDVFANNATTGFFGGALDAGFNFGPTPLTLSIVDSSFTENTAPNGAALQAAGFVVTISGSTFLNNNATGGGDAVLIGYGPATVTDSQFIGNQGGAFEYFGGFTPETSTVSVSGSLFRDNTSAGFAPAIASFGALSISGSTFEDNANVGPDLVFGGAVSSQGNTSITGSRFDGNRAQGDSGSLGGAVYVSGAQSVQFVSTVFTDNEAASPGSADGGAVYWDSNGNFSTTNDLTVSNVIFDGNRARAIAPTPGSSSGASVAGGALFASSFLGAITIEDTIFHDNAALSGPNPRFQAGSAQGGAAYISGGSLNGNSSPTTLDIRRTSFDQNEARSGDGDANTMAGEFAEGGALYTASFGYFDFTTTITDSAFTRNTAASGVGGITTDSTSPVAALGGAIRSSTILNVTRTAFTGNSALGSDALAGRNGGEADGGAVWGALNTASNVVFLGNQAVGGRGAAGPIGGNGGSASGGAVFGGGNTLTNVVFLNNQAIGGAGGDATAGGTGGRGGDAIGGGLVDSGSTTIQSSIFTGNKARGGRGGKAKGSGVGGAGGNATGGGIAFTGFSADAILTVLDSLFTGNDAFGGQGGPGHHAGADGQGLGGGIAILGGSATIKRTKFAGNHASTAGDNVYGPYTT